MAILDILKRKKQEEGKKKNETKPAKKAERSAKAQRIAKPKKEKIVKTEQVRSEPGPAEKKPKTASISYLVLKEPHVTEKASALVNINQYVFKVLPGANKNEIKQSIEGIYGVNVTGVRIINIPSKSKRVGKTQGIKSGYKKAIVGIRSGQKIDIMPR